MNTLVKLGLVVGIPLALAAVGAHVLLRGDTGLRQAERLAKAGDLRQAQVVIRAAIAKAPNDPALHLELARVVSKLADPIAAEQAYRRAVGLGLDPAGIRHELGEALLLQGKAADVLQLVPSSGPTPAITASNLLLRAIAQLSLQNVAAARDTLALARASVPDAAETSLIEARLAAQGGDQALVETAVATVLARNPDQVEALLLQGQILSARGDRDGALRMVDRAVANAPWSAMARTDRAYLLMFKGDDARAQQDVDAILASQPRFIDAVYLRGVLMARRGAFSDAAVQLSKLDGVAPRFPQVLFYQSVVAQALNRPEAAAEVAQRYNQLVPRDPDGVRQRAETALKLGNAAAVVEVLRQAVGSGQGDARTRLLLARALGDTGRPDEAARVLKEVEARDHDDPVLLAQLGSAELAAGRLKQALDLLERALRLHPDLPAALEPFALAAIQSGRLAQAEDALVRLRRLGTRGAGPDTLQGLLLHEQGRIREARTTWAQVVAQYPRTVSARIYLARLLKDEGDPASAIVMLNQALAAEPANPQTLAALLTLLPPASAEVKEALADAYKASPGQPLVTAMLADSLVAQGRPEQALALLKGQAAGSALWLGARARAQAAMGDADEAIATYRSALEESPADDAMVEAVAGLMQRTGQEEALVAVLRRNMEQRPGDLLPMTRLVQLVANTKGVKNGLALAAELRANPARMPSAAVLKGDLLVQQRRPAEAAKAFQEEYAAVPSRPLLMRMTGAQLLAGQDALAMAALDAWLAGHAPTADVLSAQVQIDLRTDNHAGAAGRLRVLANMKPGDAGVLNNLAWSYLHLGDARAQETARQAYLAGPSPDSADTLGWILLDAGSLPEALSLLTTAYRQRPSDGTIAYHLAVALERTGKRDEARMLLEKVVAGPGFTETGGAKALLERLASER